MSQRSLRFLVGAIVAVALVAPPAVLVVTQGSPTFPSRADCSRPASADAPDLEVVYGRFEDPRAADERLTALTGLGFIGAETELDACGRWKVSYDAIESFAQGQALAAQVRDAGFEANVEHGF